MGMREEREREREREREEDIIVDGGRVSAIGSLTLTQNKSRSKEPVESVVWGGALKTRQDKTSGQLGFRSLMSKVMYYYYYLLILF